jgi:hypothetical protein
LRTSLAQPIFNSSLEINLARGSFRPEGAEVHEWANSGIRHRLVWPWKTSRCHRRLPRPTSGSIPRGLTTVAQPLSEHATKPDHFQGRLSSLGSYDARYNPPPVRDGNPLLRANQAQKRVIENFG